MRIGRAVISLTLALAACRSGVAGPSDSKIETAIVGTFVLESVNGSAPPVAVVRQSGFELYIDSQSETFTPDGSVTLTRSLRSIAVGVTTRYGDSNTGTYTAKGDSVTVTFQTPTLKVSHARLVGKVLSTVAPETGELWISRKQ